MSTKYITNELNEIESLIEWFENGKDPWFDEKKTARRRDLNSFQRQYCICELHNYPKPGFNADLKKRVNALLHRAVIFSQFSAIGSKFVTDDKMQKLDYFPPIHCNGCACIVKNNLTEQEKTTITQQYKKFMQNM
jgi:hypothetical protein